VPREAAGILVDEQFGAAILRDARGQGLITCCPAEKSGQDEFDFEYGAQYREHIAEFKPTSSKALVRYNPEGDEADEPAPGGAAQGIWATMPIRTAIIHVRIAGADDPGPARSAGSAPALYDCICARR